MHNLPIHFVSEATAEKEFTAPWPITSGPSQASCSIPTEFGGTGGGFSPEDLFLQSAINCFIGTFKVMAKMSKINFSQVSVRGQLSVDKNSEGKVIMKAIHLDITILEVDRPDRINTLAAKTIKDGFILNSIKSDITYKLNIK